MKGRDYERGEVRRMGAKGGRRKERKRIRRYEEEVRGRKWRL